MAVEAASRVMLAATGDLTTQVALPAPNDALVVAQSKKPDLDALDSL